jgi:hypothetical protein
MKKNSINAAVAGVLDIPNNRRRSSTMYLLRLRSHLTSAKPLAGEGLSALQEALRFRSRK